MKKVLFLISFILFQLNLFSQNIIFKKLSNGLRYCYYKADSDVSSVVVLVRAGSIFDPKGKFGLSHFLSSALKRCGTEKYSPSKLMDLLDKYGIEVFSSSGKDFLVIGMKFINKNKVQALDIFSQILFHPRFDFQEFESLKKEIIGDIRTLKNDNDYLAIHQGFVSLISSKQYSHSSIGEINDIKRISVLDLKSFYKKYFVANNMIFSFYGKFSKSEIMNLLNKVKQTSLEKIKEPQLKFAKKGKKVILTKKLKQSYIYILFPSFGLKDKEIYATKVLAFILGGSLIGILPEKIRKEKGLAYSIFSTNYSMVHGGVFIIGLQTENRNCNKAIHTIIDVMRELKVKGISTKQVNLAKNYFSGNIYLRLQSSTQIALALAQGIYFNKKLPPWKYDERMYQKVTSAEINSVLKRIFDENKMVISIVGNIKK